MARPNRQMRTSPNLIPLIKHFEMDQRTGGPVLVAEPCVAGWPTAGWGSTTYLDENGVRQPVVTGMEFTRDECEAMLLADIERHADIIRRNVDVPLSQGEFDGLTSLSCNIKDFEPKFRRSRTLANLRDMKLSMERADRDHFEQEFTKEFLDWDKGTVSGEFQRLRGLYRRRCAERLLMLGLPWEQAASSERVALDTPFEDILTCALNIQSEEQLTIPRRGAEPEAAKPEERVPEVEPAPPSAEFDPRVSEPVRQPRQPARPTRAPARPSVNTTPIDEPDGIDPNAGTKPLSESNRGRGFAAKVAGAWTGLMGAIPALGATLSDTWVPAVAPFMGGILIFFGVMFTLGLIIYFFGDYLEKKGRDMASQYLR